MKARHRKFSDGGEVPEGGRFADKDPDIYKRARAWMDKGSPEDKPESKPAVKAASKPAAKAAPSPAPSPSPAPKSVDRSEIPKDTDVKAPASKGEDTSGPSNVGRLLAGLGAGAGVAGIAGMTRNAYKAKAALAAKNARIKEAAKPLVGPKQPVEVQNKAALTKVEEGLKAARSRPTTKTPKPTIDKAAAKKPAKTSPRERTKFDKYDEDTEFKKGGMVRGGGCATKDKGFKGVM